MHRSQHGRNSLATPSSDLINVTDPDPEKITAGQYTSYDFLAHGFDNCVYEALRYPLLKDREGNYIASESWHTLLDNSRKPQLFQVQRSRDLDKMILIRKQQSPARRKEQEYFHWWLPELQSDDDDV